MEAYAPTKRARADVLEEWLGMGEGRAASASASASVSASTSTLSEDWPSPCKRARKENKAETPFAERCVLDIDTDLEDEEHAGEDSDASQGPMVFTTECEALQAMEAMRAQTRLAQPQTITLRETQKIPVQLTQEAIDRQNGAILAGETGSGKTIMAVAIARRFGLSMMVFGPASVRDMWKETFTRFSMPGSFYSYNELSGTKASGCKHGLLQRRDTYVVPSYVREDTKPIHVVRFEQTAAWRALAPSVLLVFDESHCLKNAASVRSKAGVVLARGNADPIAAVGTPATPRLLLLSATPYDKPEHVETAMRVLGLIRSKVFYQVTQTRWKRTVNYGAVKDIGKWAKRMGLPSPIRQHKNVKTARAYIIEDYFPKHLRPLLCITAHKPVTEVGAENDCAVLYAGTTLFTEAQKRTYQEAVEALEAMRAMLDERNGVTMADLKGDMAKAIGGIQKAKVPLVAALVRAVQRRDPSAKCLVFANYVEVYDALKEALPEADMLVGTTSVSKRRDIQRRFQKATKRGQVVVAHPLVGGVGINLHDEHGVNRRYSFLLTTYSIVDAMQSAGRTMRTNQKTPALARFVYGIREERRIADALRSKGALMEKCIAQKEVTYYHQLKEETLKESVLCPMVEAST